MIAKNFAAATTPYDYYSTTTSVMRMRTQTQTTSYVNQAMFAGVHDRRNNRESETNTPHTHTHTHNWNLFRQHFLGYVSYFTFEVK